LVAKPVVQAELGEIDARIDVDAWQAERAQGVGSAGEVDMVIFQPGAPVAADGEFEAEARRPAGLVVPDDRPAAIVDFGVGVPPGKAACDIGHPPAEGVSGAAAHRADIVEVRIEGRGRQRRHIQRAHERRIRLNAQHDMVCKLAVIAGLKAADQAGHAMRQEVA
jgi:hypothetical protein